MKKQWLLLDPPPEDFYNEHPELPKIIANLLYNRDLKTQTEIDTFLNPDYTHDVHDPFLFKQMNKTVDRIFSAIQKQEKIIVHGDYDADGISASVILVSTLKILGAQNVDVFLPHRETDGYGLNLKNVKKFIDNNINLIITCDCGISNFEEIKLAQKNNIDVIITDHHNIPKQIPPAYSIIHPKIPNEPYPDKNLAGGGVAFKLMQALLKTHKKNNKKLNNNLSHEAFEKWMLDMVAIASVADMVPLIGETRVLTKYGLIVLNKTRKIGLQKLLLEARLMTENGFIKKEIDTNTIGFQIAPRINAAGRMKHANTAYNLFMTNDPITATNLAYELNQNNRERQQLTDSLVKESINIINKEQKDEPVLFILGKNWSTGLVGLIAGRLKEKYYKPTIVMAINDNEITGSGRSIEGFDIISALQEMPEFFSKFGGHPMACGFTLKQTQLLDDFKQKLKQKFLDKTTGLNLQPQLYIDSEINLEDVNWELYDLLDKFKPFGQGNEKPKYLAKNLQIIKVEGVGKDGKHIRLWLKHKTNIIRKAIGWQLCSNSNKPNWCQKLKPGDIIDMVFEIDVNEWNGNRELQLTIIDLQLKN